MPYKDKRKQRIAIMEANKRLRKRRGFLRKLLCENCPVNLVSFITKDERAYRRTALKTNIEDTAITEQEANIILRNALSK